MPIDRVSVILHITLSNTYIDTFIFLSKREKSVAASACILRVSVGH